MTIKPKAKKPSRNPPMVPTTDTMKLPNGGVVSIHVKRKTSMDANKTANAKRKCRKCVGRPRGPYRTKGISPAERLLNAILEVKPCRPKPSKGLHGAAKRCGNHGKASARKPMGDKAGNPMK